MTSIIKLLYGLDQPYYEKINDSQEFKENEDKYYENYDKLFKILKGDLKETLANIDWYADAMLLSGQETHFKEGVKAGFLLALEILNGD